MRPEAKALADQMQRRAFPHAFHLGMPGQHLFQQGRPAAGHAHDQQGAFAWIPAPVFKRLLVCLRAEGLDKSGISVDITLHRGGGLCLDRRQESGLVLSEIHLGLSQQAQGIRIVLPAYLAQRWQDRVGQSFHFGI